MINGIVAPWVPGELPTRDWAAIRATYWGTDEKSDVAQFSLGRFDRLARFFASSRAAQEFSPGASYADLIAAASASNPDKAGSLSSSGPVNRPA